MGKKKRTHTIPLTGENSALILKNIDEVIYYVKLDGKNGKEVVFLSDKIDEILGLSKEKYLKLGKKILDLCHPDDIPEITKKTGEILKKKIKSTFRYRFLNPKKKKYIWIEETIYPQLDNKKKLIGYFGVSRNIDAEKQKEDELNQRWLNYKNLIESLPSGIFIHVNGKIIFGNKEAYSIAEIKKNEDLDKFSLLDFLLPEDRTQGVERIKTAMSGKDTPFVEYNIITRKGTHKIIRTKSSPILYNATQAVQIIIQDITKEKKLEEERVKTKSTEQINRSLQNEVNLRMQTEEKLKAIFNSSSHLIWTIGKDMKITSFNEKYAETVKNQCGVILASNTSITNFKRHFTAAEYKKFKNKYTEAFKGKHQQFEIKFTAIDGTERYREVFLHPTKIKGKVNEVAAIAQDVTDRKNAEKQIVEQSAKLKAIFDSGNQRIWTVNRQFEFTSFNEHFSKTFYAALRKKPILHTSVLAQVEGSPEYDFWKQKYNDTLKGKSSEFETVFVDKTGKTVHGQVFFHPIFNEKGKVIEIAAISQDISDRKNAEKQIIEQSARLRAIFESGAQLMWTVNRNLALTSFNKNYSDAIYAMYGVYPEINLDLNKPKKKFASESYHKYWEEKYKQVFKGKSIEFDTERTTTKGEKIYRHIFLHPIYNEKSEIVEVSGVGYDVTEQKRAQDEILSKQSQLEAIINTTGDIIFSVDKNFRLVEFNEVLRGVVKARHGTKIKQGDSIFDVLPKKHHEEVRARYEEAFKGRSVLAIEQFEMAGRKRNYEAHYKPIIIDGKVTGVAVFSRDVTDQQEAKEQIITKQSQLAAIINTTDDIILSIDKKYRIVEFNDVMKEIAHLRTGKEIKAGMPFFEFLPKDRHTELKKTYDKAMSGESVVSMETFFHPKTKINRIYEAHYNPIKINGEITGIAIFSRDITAREQANEELIGKQSRLSTIINNTNDIILSIDTEYNLIEFNDILKQWVRKGFNIELKQGMSVFCTLHPAYHKQTQEIYDRVFKGESVNSIGKFGKEGNEIYFETNYNPIKTAGKITGIAIFSRDITEQKKNEGEILKSLKEKDILLKEVHHRVKNNLQVISSILNLQTAYLKDRATINILKECQNRIKTMAFIHESLYQNKDFSQINFSEYIVTLVKNLFYSFEANQQKIRANFDVEPILLNLDTSIPCGLIVNELVSNALKYAFKDREEGVVFVELKKVDGKIKMVVADNGSGLPEDVNYKNTETLGLQLVNTLTEQINGTISMKRNKGTIFEIIF